MVAGAGTLTRARSPAARGTRLDTGGMGPRASGGQPSDRGGTEAVAEVGVLGKRSSPELSTVSHARTAASTAVAEAERQLVRAAALEHRAADTNEDGRLDPAELVAYGVASDRKAARRMIREAGMDDDGQINRKEFLAQFRAASP